MTQLADTTSALLACGAVVAALFVVACVTHLKTARRASTLAIVAFGFAGLSVVVMLKDSPSFRAVGIFLGAILVGGLLALAVPRTARIAQLGWIPGLAAGGVALASLSKVLSTPGLARFALLISTLSGLAAVAVASFRLIARRDTPRSNGAIALSLTLGGFAQLVAGLWASNALVLVSGGVVTVAGFSLARAMARASGRSLSQLLAVGTQTANAFGYENTRQSDPEGAAMILARSQNVLIVPGYGLALAQGQHGVKELIERMEKAGAKVRVVVHPAAGIVPGHMNVLLDEAGIPHNKLLESAQAGSAVKGADVLVVGANDIVNSGASQSPSPLFGLEALDLSEANSIWVIKRSLGAGQGDVRNSLFELPQTTMIMGDAKKVLQALVSKFEAASH